MLDREVFEEMLKMLADTHQWKPISDAALDGMLRQLNKYGVDDYSFGEYCLKSMGAQFFKPASLVEHFQSLHVEHSRVLPQGDVKADLHSDEFVRFQRFYKDLRVALSEGKSYPIDKREFHELWVQPLEDSDFVYAESRRQSIQNVGFGVSVGGDL